jgi:hypothetical protein
MGNFQSRNKDVEFLGAKERVLIKIVSMQAVGLCMLLE